MERLKYLLECALAGYMVGAACGACFFLIANLFHSGEVVAEGESFLSTLFYWSFGTGWPVAVAWVILFRERR